MIPATIPRWSRFVTFISVLIPASSFCSCALPLVNYFTLPLRAECGFKASETLLGIETNLLPILLFWTRCFKASETLLGIETEFYAVCDRRVNCFKASETLLGIETMNGSCINLESLRFKASETLLGIETLMVQHA